MIVRVRETLRELSADVAAAVTDAVQAAIERSGRCSLLLSGGNTPRGAYELLAARHRDRMDWTHTHLFWGDERFVPHGDPHSNYRMARDAFLDHVPCPPANVHPIPTGLPSADAAALRYEATLRAHFPDDRPVFDVALLGLGDDGHTASIFAESPALDEADSWVIAVATTAEPPLRITLTMPVLTAAAHLFVLVSGAGKAGALRHALDPASDARQYPAAALQSAGGRVTWWADRAAAPDSGV